MNDVGHEQRTPTVSVEDRNRILDRLARVCRATDTEDLDALVTSYAPDGAWASEMFPPVEGRTALEAFFRGFFADDTQLFVRRGQHWLSNHVLEPETADRVVVTSNWSFFQQGEAGPELRYMGIYRDVVGRHGGRWLIERREITTTMAAP